VLGREIRKLLLGVLFVVVGLALVAFLLNAFGFFDKIGGAEIPDRRVTLETGLGQPVGVACSAGMGVVHTFPAPAGNVLIDLNELTPATSGASDTPCVPPTEDPSFSAFGTGGPVEVTVPALPFEPLPIDRTPPVVTGVAAPLANSAGWYRTPVIVEWTSIDLEPSTVPQRNLHPRL
jgi:hypothetical protein